MKRGVRKYRCDDCKQCSFFHSVEFGRRNRPRCPRCGCSFLVPASDGAADQQKTIGTARSVVHSSDDVVPNQHHAMRDKGARPTR